MRRVAYYPVFTLLWLLMSILGLFSGRHSRTTLVFFGAMVAVAAVASIYFIMLAYAPRLLYRTGIGARCPSCYCKIPRGEDFCPRCGSIVNDSISVRCPSCGTVINDHAKEFCPRCGTVVKKSAK